MKDHPSPDSFVHRRMRELIDAIRDGRFAAPRQTDVLVDKGVVSPHEDPFENPNNPPGRDGDTPPDVGVDPDLAAKSLPPFDPAARVSVGRQVAKLPGRSVSIERVGRYLVLGVLGQGGMSTVLESHDDQLDRRVALKLLHAEIGERHAARLIREAKALAKLSHPNVVHVYEFGEDGGQWFLAMELVSGETLRRWQERRPHWRECVKVYLQAGSGLAAAHAAGLVHRDFKPDNCIVDEQGRARVLDFGLVRGVEDTWQYDRWNQSTERTSEDAATSGVLTRSGTVLGTLAYMPLEQFEGKRADARSDQFSFCVSLYEALYGERPFVGNSTRTLMHALQAGKVRPPRSQAKIPTGLRRTLLRGLAREPDERWPSMDELLKELQRAVAPRKTLKALVGMLALVLLVLVIDRSFATVALSEADKERRALANEKDEEAKRADEEANNAKREREAAQAAKGMQLSARASLLADVPGKELEALELGIQALGAVEEAEWSSTDTVRGLHDALVRSRKVITFGGPGDQRIRTLAWAPDGCCLATASWGGAVNIWSGATGEALASLEGHEETVSMVAWTSDGSRLATASEDGKVMLWNTATGETLAALEGHTKGISALAWTTDGTRLATASHDKTARLWNGGSGKLLAILDDHRQPLGALAFTVNGTRLATASKDRTARLWNGVTGKSIAILEGHTDSVLFLAWSTDSNRLATMSLDGTARLWNGKTGKGVATLGDQTDSLRALAWSTNGARLATGSKIGTPRLWNGKTGEIVATLEGHTDTVHKLAWSPDGKRLATAGDMIPRLWDGGTGEALTALEGHAREVVTIAWAPDGTRLATGSWDYTTRLWDGVTGEELAILAGHTNPVVALEWSVDSTRLATVSDDGTARLWNGTTGETLAAIGGNTQSETIHISQSGDVVVATDGYGDRISKIAYSVDGARLATVGKNGIVRLWDSSTWRSIGTYWARTISMFALEWNSDGTRLAASGEDGVIRLWDGTGGQPVSAFQVAGEPIYVLAWSPDGTRLVAGGQDNVVRVWDAGTGRVLVNLEGQVTGAIFDLAWSPDGAHIAAGCFDNRALLWDASTGESIAVLDGHTMGVRALAWSPDGSRLATASWDRTARVWNGMTGELLTILKGHKSFVVALAWSPDGARLASGGQDHTARLWSGATGEHLATLEGHADAVFRLAWSPDGTRLATASQDGTAKLWSGMTGDLMATFDGHVGPIGGLAWSADGTRLSTASEDGTARVWAGSALGWLLSACEILEGSRGTIELRSETKDVCALYRKRHDF